jgi:hypothetical protein
MRPSWVYSGTGFGGRLVFIAVLTAALPVVVSMQTAGPAAAPLIEAQPAEFLVGPPPLARASIGTAQPHSNDPAAAAGAIDVPAEAGAIPGWFEERE